MVIERDRIWQDFLRSPECRFRTVYDVTILCEWWFLCAMRKRK